MKRTQHLSLHPALALARASIRAELMAYADRFLAKLRVDDNDCWCWIGATQDSNLWHVNNDVAKNAPNWRGRFWLADRAEYAHRVAWMLWQGEIPDDQVVMHVVCDNSLCCNPTHLKLGSAADNAHDRDAKGRTKAFRRAVA